jgi:hypothetical protein
MKTVLFETITTPSNHKIAMIKISRPEALNALNKQVLSELGELLGSLGGSRDLRAAILTGDGEKSFVAGADIKEMESLTSTQAREMAIHGQALFQKIEDQGSLGTSGSDFGIDSWLWGYATIEPNGRPGARPKDCVERRNVLGSTRF